ncbi:MAG: hypothetical protein RLZZ272_420 [Actinomycetota bacterium]
MPIARPSTLDGALDALASLPGADLLAGGTDLMVAITHRAHRPRDVVALRRIAELDRIEVTDTHLTLGALVRWSTMAADLTELAPGLAMAARSVGSPQIRNAGTLGGNLATASPAGDALPWLVALEAEVELASPAGTRTVAIADWLTGPKRNARADDEIVTAVRVPRTDGPQHVAKVGPRNAMVIAVASVALVLDRTARRVRVGLGSVGPTALAAPEAAAEAGAAIDWDALTCPEDAIERFAAGVAAAARPIDDHRASADYRRHVVGVLAGRTLRRCLAA